MVFVAHITKKVFVSQIKTNKIHLKKIKETTQRKKAIHRRFYVKYQYVYERYGNLPIIRKYKINQIGISYQSNGQT